MVEKPLRIAVDIGGTFVDAVEYDMGSGAFRVAKASTTPAEPAQGVLDAVAELAAPLDRVEAFIHGTTLGLNAVLERRGARTGIITNEGFRDIFLIGRGNVPDAHMYDFQYQRPEPLVKRRRIAGVRGRLDYKGREIEPLDEAGVRQAARHLVEDHGCEAIAVCYLFSFRDQAHEQRTAAILRELYPSLKVSVSSDITREQREYERTSTTVLDAYIRPIFERYVDRLQEALAERGFSGRFMIMRSGGGAMTAKAAKRSPTQTVLSGPAGGLVGAALVAEALGRPNLVTFDVGGTSLDVCLVRGARPQITHEAQLEEYPLLIPCYDIRTIGAGGGSVAWMDAGLLKVGPRSAGAQPGPICYGRGGTEPTVTDAALVLGYLDDGRFLGGRMPLDAEGARSGIERAVAAELGSDTESAAAGILDVMVARTVGAVRQITVERGADPAEFSLLAFGGAGPLIASLVAREMGLSEVVVPVAPSGFSAWGMVGADVVEDTAETHLGTLSALSPNALEARFADMEREVAASLEAQGIPASRRAVLRQMELRYLGQEHALALDVGAKLDLGAIADGFHELHEARYGHRMEADVQILNLRVRGVGLAERPRLATLAASDAPPAPRRHRPAFCAVERRMVPFAVFERADLGAGATLEGPALVDEGTCTTLVQSDQRLVVEPSGAMVISPKEVAP
jgi:N-methylhydantoinase A